MLEFNRPFKEQTFSISLFAIVSLFHLDLCPKLKGQMNTSSRDTGWMYVILT